MNKYIELLSNINPLITHKNRLLLLELVERETKKKVIKKKQGLEISFKCPCNRLLSVNEKHYNIKYCPYCGQALDWSDTNEKSI